MQAKKVGKRVLIMVEVGEGKGELCGVYTRNAPS